jgi:hypothetical protein
VPEKNRPLGGEHAVRAGGRGHSGQRRGPQQQPDGQDPDRAPGGGAFGVQGVVGHERRWSGVAVAVIAGPQGLRGEPVQQPAGACRGRDHGRERHREHGQGEKRRHRQGDQRRVGQATAADPPHGLGDHGEHGRGEPGEDGDHGRGRPVGDIDGREGQQRDHPGQDEQGAGDQAATDAVEQPADVDGQLLGFRAREQHAVVERVQEPALPDPAVLLDQRALHDRDLPGRATERLQRDREPGAHRLAERDHVTGRRRRGPAVGPGGALAGIGAQTRRRPDRSIVNSAAP